MSSIPLPALGIKPAEQPDLLGHVGKALAVKGEMQQQQSQALQLQQQQRQLQDQQTIMQAAAAHNGSLMDALPELAGKISAASYVPLQKSIIDTQKAMADKKKIDLENEKASADQLLGLVSQAKQLPPDQYQQAWPQIAAQAQKIEPRLQFNPQQPIPQQYLDHVALGIATQSQLAGMESEKRAQQEELRKQADEQRKVAAAPAELAKAQAEAALKQKQAEMGGTDDTSKYIANYLRTHGLSDTPANWMKAHQAYTKETKVDPGVMRMEVLANTRPVQVIDPNNPDQVIFQSAGQAIKSGAASPQSIPYQTEKGLQKEFTTGSAAKNLTAFNTAIEHANQLRTAADALQNGDVRSLNKIGNEMGYQFGSDKMSNFNVIKNALAGEVSKVFKGGQATDAEIKEVQAPFDAANSPAQLKGAIENAVHLMNSKRDALKQQYEAGQKGKPNFGGQQTAQPTNDFFSNFGGKAR